MSRVDLSNLRVGDVIKTSRTMNVVAKHPGGREVEGAPDFFRLEDVQSGQAVYVEDGGEQGSWSWEMVKTAKREFKVGDTVTSEADYEQLPRGTVVCAGDREFPFFRVGTAWIGPMGTRHADRAMGSDESPDRTIIFLPKR